MEDVRADDPRHREGIDEHHHQSEIGAAAHRGDADDEAEDRAGGERDELVAATHDERRLARLHPALHQRLGEEAAPTSDQRSADGIPENRLRVTDLVTQHPGHGHAGDRQRPGAGEKPEREVAMHGAEAAMPDRPERLEDRAVEDVRPDRVRRLEAEDDDEDRRHERAAADAGKADHDADDESRYRVRPIEHAPMIRGAVIPEK